MIRGLEGRHESTRQVARWFEYGHLPPAAASGSELCADLATQMVELLPDSPELTAGLRKLLEAKDCFVRAAIAAAEQAAAEQAAAGEDDSDVWDAEVVDEPELDDGSDGCGCGHDECGAC